MWLKQEGWRELCAVPPPLLGRRTQHRPLKTGVLKKNHSRNQENVLQFPPELVAGQRGHSLLHCPGAVGSHTAKWPRPTPGPGLRGAEAHTHLLQGLPVQRLGVEDLRAALALPALQPVQARCAGPRRAARRLRRRAGGGRGALGRGRQAWRPTGNASDGRGFAAERRVGEWVKWCCPGEKVRSWQPGPHPHIHLVARRARMSLEFKPYNFY